MPPTTKAALLVVVNNIDGDKWFTSAKNVQEEETYLHVFVAARIAPRTKMVVRDNTPPPSVLQDLGAGCWRNSSRKANKTRLMRPAGHAFEC